MQFKNLCVAGMVCLLVLVSSNHCLAGSQNDVSLLTVVKEHNLNAVTYLLAHGANVNETDGDTGMTPLHFAAVQGDLSILSALIANGANINAKIYDGATPLHLAAWAGQTQTVLALVKKNADIEAQDSDGLTPLHYAVWKDKSASASLLVSNGANINARAKNGNTPLHTAVESGSENCIESLVERNANMNIKNNDGKTIIDIIDDNKNLKRQYMDSGIYKALVYAKKKQLLADNIFVPERESTPTATPTAASDKNSAVALDNKAEAPQVEKPLAEATQSANEQVAQNTADMPTQAAVSVAPKAEIENTPPVQKIEEQSAKPDLVAEAKVEPKANPTPPVVQKIDEPKQVEAKKVEPQQAKKENKYRPIPVAHTKLTPLHHAAQKGDAITVLKLIKSGADKNVGDGSKFTPLHTAVWYGHPKVASLLLTLGADPKLKDIYRRTPLDMINKKPALKQLFIDSGVYEQFLR